MSVRLARMESVRKLKTIEKESTGIICFIQRLAQCCQSVGTLVIIVSLCLVVIGIGIAKMVMGSLFFHACPAQPLIPIWLIVGAMVSFLYTSASQTSKVAGGEHNNDARNCLDCSSQPTHEHVQLSNVNNYGVSGALWRT
ncbi:uncharacterized protein LOC121384615 isoform X2 [Gigantopelta aegis]|uniref:uncharacterized protein LOC121384615 isoform X2 n=1 Tax=Gigantopelta aegis TaxID=1735272 RepID=UPI001B88D0BF|nr:uncharacterized protein LOC121384615 isoform X2 [Gigantopelta aegis]